MARGIHPAVLSGHGLAVALEEALKREALWLGWSGRVGAETSEVPSMTVKGKITVATLDLGEADYQRFYVGFANGVLWPLLHFRLGLMQFRREDYAGYLSVNRSFAESVAPLLQAGDTFCYLINPANPTAAIESGEGLKAAAALGPH